MDDATSRLENTFDRSKTVFLEEAFLEEAQSIIRSTLQCIICHIVMREFSEDDLLKGYKNIIGKGAFGVVYRGEILPLQLKC